METRLKALIIDDEEGARQLLKKLLDETHMFQELKLAGSAANASKELKDFQPDMIFLDIRMPGKDGFEFLKDLTNRNGSPGVVFVTAYEQYALKAIKYQAFDYLLKPVNRKELKQCVQKYVSSRVHIETGQPVLPRISELDKLRRIKVSTRTGTLFLNPSNILYCKADGNYTNIYSGGKELLCSMNIGKIREMLPENSFIRLGRSLIINIEHITLLDRRQSTVTLVYQGESVKVKIPRLHLKDLEQI
jgi:DNA-binding LytR/AlgR family response regulator